MPLTFTADQAKKLVELLGLPADIAKIPDGTSAEDAMTAVADQILAVIEDLVKSEKTGDEKPSEIAAAAGRLGLTVVDADTLTKLQSDADEGRQIKAAAAKKAVESTVDDAIRKGKITPARREHWVKLIAADAGMADVLAGVPNETAAPLSELGHATGDDITDTPDWFR